MVTVLSAARIRVWPSGGALATSTMAMLPLAPARFSITTDQPRLSWRDRARSRAEMSGAPPGGMVTSMRIGREGYGAWACAGSRPNRAAKARRARQWAADVILPPAVDPARR